MLAHDGLIAFDLGSGVNLAFGMSASEGSIAKGGLDGVVHGKVNRPGWQVSEDRWTEAAIESAQAIESPDCSDGTWMSLMSGERLHVVV